MRGSSRILRAQLPVTDVERDDLRGPALQEDVGVPAGPRADVEAVEAPRRRPRTRRGRSPQLVTCARRRWRLARPEHFLPVDLPPSFRRPRGTSSSPSMSAAPARETPPGRARRGGRQAVSWYWPTPYGRRARRRSRPARRVGVVPRRAAPARARRPRRRGARLPSSPTPRRSRRRRDVVDDLEEAARARPRTRATRLLLAAPRRRERAHQAAEKSAPVFSRCSSSRSASPVTSSQLAADHRERRPDELARDRARPPYESASRTASASRASPASTPSPRRTAPRRTARRAARRRRRARAGRRGRARTSARARAAAAGGQQALDAAPIASPVARQSTGRTRLPPSA